MHVLRQGASGRCNSLLDRRPRRRRHSELGAAPTRWAISRPGTYRLGSAIFIGCRSGGVGIGYRRFVLTGQEEVIWDIGHCLFVRNDPCLGGACNYWPDVCVEVQTIRKVMRSSSRRGELNCSRGGQCCVRSSRLVFAWPWSNSSSRRILATVVEVLLRCRQRRNKRCKRWDFPIGGQSARHSKRKCAARLDI